MTKHTLDFWFDYSCPYAYLASTQVEVLAQRIDAALTLRPMLLGGIFRALDQPQNLAATLSEAKARHNANDMVRWAEHFGVGFAMPGGHPMRTVEALRATIATGVDPKVMHGFFRAYWVEGREVSSPETLRVVLTAAGHDADAVLARIGEESIKNDLRARTDEALARGVFGAPALSLDGGEIYWGQDKFALIEHAAGVARTRDETAAAPTGRTLEFYWDFSSPYAYLGNTQAEALAARTGATLVSRPMLLGGVFRAIGQVDVPLASWPAAKQRHAQLDMPRWAEALGVEFHFPERFPMNTVKALRCYLALPEARREDFRRRVFRAYWVDGRDINDDATLAALVGDDGAAVLARTQDPAIKQALIDATRHAVDAGVFGAPTFVVDGQALFWGQDREALIARALTRSTTP